MQLQAVLRDIAGNQVSGDQTTAIRGIAYDSRQVEPGFLFAALEGEARDGHDFLDQARARGAVAVLSARPRDPRFPGLAWVQVEDARRGLALASRNYYGRPDERLMMLGVTGTNGKTTVCHLLEGGLREAGLRPCLLGTVSYRYGKDETRADRTTPESLDLQRHLDRFATAGARSCAMEVSSHALALRRVAGIAYRAAVFTNLTQDHLDFHSTMEEYFQAKALLFRSLKPDAVAVLNADDPAAERLAAVTGARVVTFGESARVHLRLSEVRATLAGTEVTLTPSRGLTDRGTEDGPIAVRSPLLGRHNASNLAAAAATLLSVGVPAEAVPKGLAAVTGVPGRMERVDDGSAFIVLVDYAHTDDALTHLLESVRALQPKRVITVFGCGGDRDRDKRPKMGFAAASHSDIVVVTSDNPRTEDPHAIVRAILPGVARALGVDPGAPLPADRCHVLVDRREAIHRAVSLARPGDAVVIAGKGHEPYQILGERTVPFDDRQVARDALHGGGAVRGRAACE
ncbi:MAG TPA: UDP-N-acetylmuramoyl-L-alanyl-D-glutamate--2,6-diaminopimelate ligase [Candidatus Polarisedimenticolia bacterium]|nr:UDP-N-acetylmuramoyl-L-alanyl-D-glutamate--2,6-diaminopimelate ligase [Candidatus Polarisedimenticolia bacterium]